LGGVVAAASFAVAVMSSIEVAVCRHYGAGMFRR
jgi:carbonic anhydrase